MYRTRIIVDVLHEDPIPDSFELGDIIDEGGTGAYVIDAKTEAPEKLTKAAMAGALRAAGSTPDFFRLDEED